jgi:hypothetical protein
MHAGAGRLADGRPAANLRATSSRAQGRPRRQRQTRNRRRLTVGRKATAREINTLIRLAWRASYLTGWMFDSVPRLTVGQSQSRLSRRGLGAGQQHLATAASRRFRFLCHASRPFSFRGRIFLSRLSSPSRRRCSAPRPDSRTRNKCIMIVRIRGHNIAPQQISARQSAMRTAVFACVAAAGRPPRETRRRPLSRRRRRPPPRPCPWPAHWIAFTFAVSDTFDTRAELLRQPDG